MLKYDEECKVFLSPICNKDLRELEERFIIQTFECDECNLTFDSNGDILSEEEQKNFIPVELMSE